MCFKKCLRPSKSTDLLAIIFGVVGNKDFRWDQIKEEIPDLPRQPPVSLIEKKMLISKGRSSEEDKRAHQIWSISQDVTYWLQNPEPERVRRRNN
jgi:hypothetical protein